MTADTTDSKQDLDSSEEKKSTNPKNKKKAIRYIMFFIMIIVVILIGLYWWFTRNDVSTDDAFTAGRAITIAPHVNGYVTELLVNDNQFVHKGQVLLRIDSRDYKASLLQAQGNLERAKAQYLASQYLLEVAKKNYPGQLKVAEGQLEAAKAQLFKAKTDYVRQHNIARPATTQQAIDYATSAFNQAKAEVDRAEGNYLIATPVEANIGNVKSKVSDQGGAVKAAEAQLETAALNVGWTEIRAPHDGWISKRNVEQGSYVTVGQSLLSIVEPEVWVIGNYKETQITNVRPGQKVKIEVDAYPFMKLKGHVDSIQAGTGSVFSAFPPENATGNYVKIVQRVPVKILIDEGLDPKVPLAIGLSVVPTVYTK